MFTCQTGGNPGDVAEGRQSLGWNRCLKEEHSIWWLMASDSYWPEGGGISAAFDALWPNHPGDRLKLASCRLPCDPSNISLGVSASWVWRCHYRMHERISRREFGKISAGAAATGLAALCEAGKVSAPRDMPTVRIGEMTISRFIVGGNPFSGFSHQSNELSKEMLDWYTGDRLKRTLEQAADEARCLGAGAEAFPADVSDEQ